MITWALSVSQIKWHYAKTWLNLMKKCSLTDLFCLHRFCNGAQVTLPKIGQP